MTLHKMKIVETYPSGAMALHCEECSEKWILAEYPKIKKIVLETGTGQPASHWFFKGIKHET